jgi:hypothetical protein
MNLFFFHFLLFFLRPANSSIEILKTSANFESVSKVGLLDFPNSILTSVLYGISASLSASLLCQSLRQENSRHPRPAKDKSLR